MSSYLLIQSTQAPYSSSASIDALEAALAASNIGLNVKYVFVDDGVYQLVNNQNSAVIAHKNTSKKLAVLPLFDIEDIFVCAQSASERQIDITTLKLVDSLSAKRLTMEQLFDLTNNAKHVLVF